MPLVPSIRELERVRLTCPLGIRFWDSLTGGTVGDGLRVTAAPVDQTEVVRRGIPNRRNGFVFHDLPGLRDFERGEDHEAPFDASPPRAREFLIRLEDEFRRFLPLSFRAIVPHEGWFSLSCDASPPDHPVGSVPLFNSPGRILGGGVAVVRADLWDTVANGPAAWALLEVSASTPTGTEVVRGLANEDGRVLLAFAYPELPPASLLGSPAGSGTALHLQSWDLSVSVLYSALPPETSGTPDLCDILNQPAASVLDRDELPLVVLTGATLWFGQELILRSSGDGQGRVLVRPA